MQVDELRTALQEAAAGQAPVSPTARRDIRRRVLVRRVAGAALTLAVIGTAAGVAVTANGHRSAQGTRVITQPGVTTSVSVAPVPTTIHSGPTRTTVTPRTTPANLTTPNSSQVPLGFGLTSITFVSATEGWALGAVNCATGATNCPAVLAHTTDGGRTWARVPAPPTTLSPAPDASSGVGQVRFANRLDGWVYGPDLWVTYDGGAHWLKSTFANVYALEAGAGTVHAVLFDQASTSFRIESSPVDQDAWARSSTSLQIGAGPIPDVQLVLNATTGWILENDRVVIAGARLVGGRWQPWTPPCTTVGGPAYLAASDATHLVADCTEGVWTGPAISDHLYFSSDGGATFSRVAGAAPARVGGSIASPAPGVVFAAAASQIFGTFNSGASWQAVYVGGSAQANITLVGFTTPAQGIAITGNGELVMTRDGGHTWQLVPFG